MSPLLIGGLLAGGLIILVCIGFISHSLERNRLEKARQTAELNARIKVCRQATGALPGQFLPAELGTLMLQIEISLLERLQRIGKSQDVQQRLDQARAAQTEGKVPSNPPVELDSEARGKEARLQLENLFKQLQQAERDGLIDNATLKHWGTHVRRSLITANLETFNATAKQAMSQGKPRVAKLQYASRALKEC